MRWAAHAGRWHVLDADATLCRLEFLTPPRIVKAEEGEMPPTPCRTCLMVIAMEDVEEEPLEVARARGLEVGVPMAADDEG